MTALLVNIDVDDLVRGVAFYTRAFDLSGGRLARMADPFGNGLCVLQFVGHGYDEIAEPT